MTSKYLDLLAQFQPISAEMSLFVLCYSFHSRWVLRWKTKCPKYWAVITALSSHEWIITATANTTFYMTNTARRFNQEPVISKHSANRFSLEMSFFLMLKFVSFELGFIVVRSRPKILPCHHRPAILLVSYNRQDQHHFLHQQYHQMMPSKYLVYWAQCQPISTEMSFFCIMKFVSFEMGFA